MKKKMTESEILDELKKIRDITDREICSITAEEAVRNCKIAEEEIKRAREEIKNESEALSTW